MATRPSRRASSGAYVVMRWPSNSTVPPSGSSAPVRMRTSVDLPAPFSPTSAWISPARTSSEASTSARMPEKLRETWETASTAYLDRAALVGQLADPDVPEAHRVVVVLQRQRHLRRVRFVVRRLVVERDAHHGHVVLDQHAVVEDREGRALNQLAVGVELRRVEHDVVGLPLAGL